MKKEFPFLKTSDNLTKKIRKEHKLRYGIDLLTRMFLMVYGFSKIIIHLIVKKLPPVELNI